MGGRELVGLGPPRKSQMPSSTPDKSRDLTRAPDSPETIRFPSHACRPFHSCPSPFCRSFPCAHVRSPFVHATSFTAAVSFVHTPLSASSIPLAHASPSVAALGCHRYPLQIQGTCPCIHHPGPDYGCAWTRIWVCFRWCARVHAWSPFPQCSRAFICVRQWIGGHARCLHPCRPRYFRLRE